MPEEYLAKVAAARHADEQQRVERLNQLRHEDREQLASRRLRRQRVRSTETRRISTSHQLGTQCRWQAGETHCMYM